MKQSCFIGAALCGVLFASTAPAQSVSVKWQLNNTTQLTATSTVPAWATGNPQIVSGGPAPVVQVFDYWLAHVPQSQRLWSGTSGWIAGTENLARFIQFDAVPAAGHQLAVTKVSFNYGGAGINGHVRANVYYSTNNWVTRTLLSPGPLAYPHPAMLSFAKTFAAPPVSGTARFSLRIYPYAVHPSNPMSPTFAAHNNVVITGTRTPATVTQCPNPTQSTIGCRVTVTVKRTKGPATYSVLVSPTSPIPNVSAPSTAASCVIAGMATINQTTCWFNYNTNPQPVTLTATSSTGTLPPGFSWSGACASFGSNPQCTLGATLLNPPVVTANFP